MPNDIQKVNFIANIHNFVKTKIADSINNEPKGLPGHVSKILPNDFVEFTIDATGPYTLPKLEIPQAFSKYHREPTQVGDKGVAVGSSINIGGSSGNDGSTANMYKRGNLTTGTFHPISNKNFPTRDQNQFLQTGGPSGHKVQSADTKTSTTIDNSGSGKIDHVASKGITQTATNGDIDHTAAQGNITHGAINGVMNLVQKTLNIGKAADSTTIPPVPSLPTIMNLIGSLTASGSMGAAGGFGGNSSGSGAAAGNVGEVISSVVLSPVTLTAATGINVAFITLTAGDWDIQGNIWQIIGAGASTTNAVGISTVSATLPSTMALNTARIQTSGTTPASGVWITNIGSCRALLTTSTIYYLVGFSQTAATATGNIWARRMS